MPDMLLGERANRKAAELYSKAALEYGGQEIFREMFGKDKETLVRQGISEKDIPLMMDLV